MHVNHLPISFVAINYGSHDYKSLPLYKVSNTSFVLAAVASVSSQIKLQRGDQAKQEYD